MNPNRRDQRPAGPVQDPPRRPGEQLLEPGFHHTVYRAGLARRKGANRSPNAGADSIRLIHTSEAGLRVTTWSDDTYDRCAAGRCSTRWANDSSPAERAHCRKLRRIPARPDCALNKAGSKKLCSHPVISSLFSLDVQPGPAVRQGRLFFRTSAARQQARNDLTGIVQNLGYREMNDSDSKFEHAKPRDPGSAKLRFPRAAATSSRIRRRRSVSDRRPGPLQEPEP